MPRLLIVTDAWHPQVNGVVRSLETVGHILRNRGYTVEYLTPGSFWTVPLPSYPEIRVPIPSPWTIEAFVDAFEPDHIHISTEGPLGLAVRGYCLHRRLAFTTSYHTRFPEYLAARLPVPVEWSYGYLRWFHAPAARTMVPAVSVHKDLRRRLFRHLGLWSRGVDLTAFSPGAKTEFKQLPGPIMLYVGRVAVEKSVENFLALNLPGTKVVVGDGPQRASLQAKYPGAVFTGTLKGEALRDAYRSADVLVFPSRTDTFGNVIVEAMACGTPVAGYPVMGPIDIIGAGQGGALHEDLGSAVLAALRVPRAQAHRRSRDFNWEHAANQFVGHLSPVRVRLPVAA